MNENVFSYKNYLHLADDIQSVLKWDGGINDPVISIVMVAYNHPHFFIKALDSALNQTFEEPYEIVICDNNMENNVSNCNEFEDYVVKCNSPKVRYYKNVKNIGGCNNVNRCVTLSRADYFIFLHDDDELDTKALESLWRIRGELGLQNELLIPQTILIDSSSNNLSKSNLNSKNKKSYRLHMIDWFMGCFTNGGGVLHSRDVFMEIGGYNPNFIPSSDYGFYINYHSKYGSVFCRDLKFYYRVAENDASTAFSQCIERDEQFRNDIINQYSYFNNAFFKYLSRALKNNRIDSDNLFWMKRKTNNTTLLQKIIIHIVTKIVNILRAFR